MDSDVERDIKREMKYKAITQASKFGLDSKVMHPKVNHMDAGIVKPRIASNAIVKDNNAKIVSNNSNSQIVNNNGSEPKSAPEDNGPEL